MSCDACVELLGKSPWHEPHAGLRYVGGVTDAGGSLERYECGVCGASLQRLLPARGAAVTEQHHWSLA
jgi:hypothetical protein